MIRPFLVGFATTLKHIFRKPITVNYPDEKVQVFPKWRGKQVLMRDENGLEKCVACGLCSVACPADAIYLEAAEKLAPLGVKARVVSLPSWELFEKQSKEYRDSVLNNSMWRSSSLPP